MDENQTPEKKPIRGIEVVAYNLGALVFYTLLLKMGAGSAGILVDALLIVAHAIFCFTKAGKENGQFWLLSAFIVLIVGVSTCVRILG